MRQPPTRGYLLAAALVLASACGPTVQGNNHDGGLSNGDGAPCVPGPHTFLGITVTPTNPLIQLDINATGTQQFKALAVYGDCTTEDETSMATFTSSNPAAGTMTADTLAIPAFTTATAVVSLVTATVGSNSGQAQITIAAYRQTGPVTDFFFVLPYQDSGGPQMKPLQFSTVIPSLDVFFNMDTTGSMQGEIGNLESALSGTVFPQVKAAVANSQFGVGALEDFPVDGYGDTSCGGDGTNDEPFKLRQPITSDATAITNAVSGLTKNGNTIGCGGDGPEAGIESLYQVATGAGLSAPSPTSVPANHTGLGGAGFRMGTMPVIVQVTDADSHVVASDTSYTPSCNDNYDANVSADAHSIAQTKMALAGICARVVGMAAVNGTCDGESYLTDFATSSGARVPPVAWDVGGRPAGCAETQCCIGKAGVGMPVDSDGLCPLVFRVGTDGTGVGTSVAQGISLLARFASFDVNGMANGGTTDSTGMVTLPAGKTTADFVKGIVPTSFVVPAPPPVLPNPTLDPTEFHGVTPGTQLSFNVNAFNDVIAASNQALIFTATIQVLASGCTSLDQHNVLILVPPTPLVIQ